MLKWIKEKLKKCWRWFVALFVGTVLAAGTQTTILDTSIFNYPLTANTNMEKLEFLYQSREALNQENNEMGKKFKKGEITWEEWEKYKVEEFRPKSKWIGWGTSVIGEKIPDIVIGTEISTSTGKIVEIKVKARQHYKEDFKKSTTWEVNLKELLKDKKLKK